MSEKRYRVEIRELPSGKVLSVIGEHLREKDTIKRQHTGISRVNLDMAYVDIIDEATGEQARI